MGKKKYTLSSNNPDDTNIRSGSIAPPVGSRTVNGAPNRNLSLLQFRNAHSFEQQRLL